MADDWPAAHDVHRQSVRRNVIANAANELKGILVRTGDFVHVMSQRGNYVDRVVLSSPVHRHTLIVVSFSEYALIACCRLYLYSFSDSAGF